VPARTLRQDSQADQDEDGDHGRCEWPTEREAAVREWLIEEIADRCAEWPAQDEGRPEQEDARDIAREVQPKDDSESPPVSPRVVAAILMIQKARVTSGTLLSASCLRPSFITMLPVRGWLSRNKQNS